MQDFRQARWRASLEVIMAGLTGRSIDLLSYEDIRQKFKIVGGSTRGLRDIPLDAIVGSVGRYNDFTRTFLPRQDNAEQRWASVQLAQVNSAGLPPIEVYQIGQVYFVVDGNHRVSVARQLGASHIQAHVTQFKTTVPLEPDDQPDDIIIKAELANFLERTGLEEVKPEANFEMTAPGRYWELDTQIEAHRYLISQTEQRHISYPEAVIGWYEQVYLPVIKLIRERGILQDFPGRTETDLYLWIFRHRAELEKNLGWQIDAEAAASDLVSQHGKNARRMLNWVEAITPDELEAGPHPGQWRRDRLEPRARRHLFGNILVSLSGRPESWCALEQAMFVARHEHGQIYGLHVVSTEAEAGAEAALAVQAEFNRRCRLAGIKGNLSIEVGPVARKITERSRWADLVVVHLAHPPGAQTFSRLGSGLRALLHRCPRPVLTVPGVTTAINKALVAYDGSPKAQEGLFVSAYLAAQQNVPVVVLTIAKNSHDRQILSEAQSYLEARGAKATYILTEGDVPETILQTVARQQCDLLIMGGYGFKPVLEVVLGSSVDHILREIKCPVLICR